MEERRIEKGEITPQGYKVLARRVLLEYERTEKVGVLLNFVEDIAGINLKIIKIE